MCTYKDAGMLRAPSGVISPQCHTHRGGGRGRNVCLWSCILLLTICISEMGLCLSSISTLFCGCLPCSGPLPQEGAGGLVWGWDPYCAPGEVRGCGALIAPLPSCRSESQV